MARKSSRDDGGARQPEKQTGEQHRRERPTHGAPAASPRNRGGLRPRASRRIQTRSPAVAVRSNAMTIWPTGVLYGAANDGTIARRTRRPAWISSSIRIDCRDSARDASISRRARTSRATPSASCRSTSRDAEALLVKCEHQRGGDGVARPGRRRHRRTLAAPGSGRPGPPCRRRARALDRRRDRIVDPSRCRHDRLGEPDRTATGERVRHASAPRLQRLDGRDPLLRHPRRTKEPRQPDVPPRPPRCPQPATRTRSTRRLRRRPTRGTAAEVTRTGAVRIVLRARSSHAGAGRDGSRRRVRSVSCCRDDDRNRRQARARDDGGDLGDGHAGHPSAELRRKPRSKPASANDRRSCGSSWKTPRGSSPDGAKIRFMATPPLSPTAATSATSETNRVRRAPRIAVCRRWTT